MLSKYLAHALPILVLAPMHSVHWQQWPPPPVSSRPQILPRRVCRIGELNMVSSKGRTWLYVGITSFKGKIGLTFLFLLFSATCFASAAAGGGACPSGVPVTGNNCYFVAANGSDSYSGTQETISGSNGPWLHAPGMPNCSSNCLAQQTSGSVAGNGIIFRGGDTWHFGEQCRFSLHGWHLALGRYWPWLS